MCTSLPKACRGLAALALLLLLAGCGTPSMVVSVSGASATLAPTASPTIDPTQPYSSLRPGPGAACTQGTAQWSRDDDATTTFRCTSNGMTLTRAATAGGEAAVDFLWPGHPFLASYAVTVALAAIQPGSCAGIARFAAVETAFLLCDDGSWWVEQGAPAKIVARGSVAASDSASLSVRFAPGALVATCAAAQLPPFTLSPDSAPTTRIALIVTARVQGAPAMATFTRFHYQPLP